MQSVTSALSVFQRFLNCQTKRILIGRFDLLLSVIAQGLDVRLAGKVSKAVVKIGAFRNPQSDVILAHAHIGGRQRIGQPHWICVKCGLVF